MQKQINPSLCKENPDWVNSVLLNNWEWLTKRMPAVAKQVSKRFGQRIPDPLFLLPKSPSEEELGSGAFGAVYGTRIPGIVFKLTSDFDEAKIIQQILNDKLTSRLPGIVRYYGIVPLPLNLVSKSYGAYVWAIWREEAFAVGWENVRYYFQAIGKQEEFYAAYEALFNYRESINYKINTIAKIIENILQHKMLRPIGKTLEFLLSKKIIFADLHQGNIGLVTRGGKDVLVITDPGLATSIYN